MKAILEQARYIFLESTGWTHLDTRGRWVAVYFALSLTAIGILKEAPVWVWIAVALNFMNAARMVRTIDIPGGRGSAAAGIGGTVRGER